MKPAFQSATKRFNKIKEKEYFVNPISENDVEIYTEIGQILKKAGLDEVYEIFTQYKEISDNEIRDRLMQWNINNPTYGLKGLINKKANDLLNGEGDDEEEVYNNPFRIFVNFGEYKILLGHILGIKTEDVFIDGEDVFKIIINPTPDNVKKVPLYANTEVIFNDYDYRNEVISKFKEILEDCGMQIEDLME